jgi:hypothetical protein
MVFITPIRALCSLAFSFSLLLACAPSASATPEYYELSGGSVTANSSEPGLVINTSVLPSVAGTSFTLDDGNSSTFAFFDIWTDETSINPDDKLGYAISATLNFVDPLTGATVNGVTIGGAFMQGLSQWGQVTWNGPVMVNIPGDRAFNITLSDETFNWGFGGLNEGMMCGATVSATITQVSSTTPEAGRPGDVPDKGNSLALFGAALCAVALARCKSVRG